ncbi:hypothetical protein SOASR014_46650 [Pectobacterium carotovorum subsp. carotovorum]|nr:hypothetical protein SOASR014_46650 [Pectobacterium carotovorum subsp. carotovorum]
MSGIGLDQSALLILPVFGQHGFLTAIDTLYLAQEFPLPHQQQLDAVAVPHLAQIAFGVAEKVDTVLVIVGDG